MSAENGTQLDALKMRSRSSCVGPADVRRGRSHGSRRAFLAAEFVREKVYRLVGEEIPYSTTVTIDRFEQEGKLRRIFASVLVDRASQRAILLGEGGQRMKSISMQARRDLERLFDGPVYLEVWVRVKKGWADDAPRSRASEWQHCNGALRSDRHTIPLRVASYPTRDELIVDASR